MPIGAAFAFPARAWPPWLRIGHHKPPAALGGEFQPNHFA